ncbi:MAG: hypothetical protein OER95_08590 [Acidimicrobiia bacterium]|nr:hypothetical protein [Acidimicrobiia bacterium]
MRRQEPNEAIGGRLSRPALAGAALLAAIALGAGGMAGCGDTDQDPLTVATELADGWAEGWNNDDPEAVTSVFADDGFFIDV